MKEPSSPEACVLPDGRVGVFVGGRYAFLSAEEARAFAERLDVVVGEAETRHGAVP